MQKVNSKKKGIILLIAVMLLVGGSMGSYAWFKSNAEIRPNLAIKVGTFNIENVTSIDEKWELVDKTSEAEVGVSGDGKAYDFTNVRPGDSFKKTFTIENTGSLDQKLLITAVDEAKFKEYFNTYGTSIEVSNLGEVIILKSLEGKDVKELAAKSKANFIVTIEVNGANANENLEGKSIDLKTALDSITFINIEATQTNAPVENGGN